MATTGKARDILTELLRCRPVAYYPALARRVGGVKAAVLLSQLIYWSTNASVQERGGWFYKSVDDLEAETGLTKREQQTARDQLIKRNLIDVQMKGLPRVWWYRFNMDSLVDYITNSTVEPPALGRKPPQRWNQNRPNDGAQTAPTLEPEPPQRLDANRPNIDAQTAPILEPEPPQYWNGLSSNLIGTIDYNIDDSIDYQETTTTTAAAIKNSGQVVVDAGDDLTIAFDQIGFMEGARGDILNMARLHHWTTGQLVTLINWLHKQIGADRACQVLQYRLANDNPSVYNPDSDSWGICDRCHQYPCICEQED